MKMSSGLRYTKSFHDAVTEVQKLERAGLDAVWVPELYTFDAVSQMGYSRGRYGAGVIRYAQAATVLVNVWCAAHYYYASRYLKHALDNAPA